MSLHTNAVLVDDVLSLGLCGRHACGTGRACEEASYEVNGGRFARDRSRVCSSRDGLGTAREGFGLLYWNASLEITKRR